MKNLSVPGRATRRVRRLPRLDARLTVGLGLVALSIFGGLRLAAAADATVPVVVAARDLPANHVLARDDLRIGRIHASASVLGGLERGARRDALVGRVVVFPIRESSLVGRDGIARAPRAGREVTVPVTPEHALGGRLRVGDRVDVLASFTKIVKQARTLTVTRHAEVVDVIRSDGVFGQHAGQLTAVTLSVLPDDAVFLAFAIRNGELDVLRATGGDAAARDRYDVSELP